MRGRFITFEGVDGTGKSTQIEMLAKKMTEEGYDVVVTKEPGSPADPTGLGTEIRQILFHTVKTQNLARGVADLLFLADHVQHVAKVVEPALEAGKVVLSDRYADSEWAYAVSEKQTPAYALEAFQAAYGPLPDVTILLVAADVGIMLERAQARRGGIETNKQDGKSWNKVQSQQLIQNEYLSRLVGQERTVVITVYPDQTPGQVFEMIWGAIVDKLARPVQYIVGERVETIAISDAAPQL